MDVRNTNATQRAHGRSRGRMLIATTLATLLCPWSSAPAFAAKGTKVQQAEVAWPEVPPLQIERFTLANGMALDSFWIQNLDGKPVTEPAALRRLSDTVEKVISKSRRLGRKLCLKATLPARTRVFRDQARVVVDNKASNTQTVIEVNGRDRPGFLYDVTTAFS